MPGRAERALAGVVDLGGIRVQVEVRGLGDELRPELAVREAGLAVLAAERVEVGPHVAVGPADLVEERRPTATVGDRVARRERRRWPGPSSQSGCRTRSGPTGAPTPRSPGTRRRCPRRSTSGPTSSKISVESRVDVLRAVDERLPGRRDELAQLLERRLAEDRRRVADEVDPELAGDLRDLGRRPETHQPLLEALRLERARERLLDDEHDPMAPRPKHVCPIPTQLFVGP